MRRVLFAAAIALAAPVPLAAQAEAWWSHVTALAHDSMRGRQTGSPEHRKAAEYVAAAFGRAGLRPAGSDGWFQPVPFTVRRIREERSSVTLVRDGEAVPLVLGSDATVNLRSSRSGSVEAPLVFIGYGMRAPERGLDDFEGVDLKGKAAVVLAGGAPLAMSGPELAAARSAGAEALRASGAVAVLSVYPSSSDLPWSRYTLSRLHPQMQPAAEAGSHDAPSWVSVVLSPERGDLLFAGSGHEYGALRALADSGAALPRFPLSGRVRVTVEVEESDAVSDNVVGLLPGSDPALRDEYVVLTAHLDHLGVGEPVGGDSIYNGAMDNASGIATLIETAALVAGRQPAPRRPVLFVAVTAEEKGLLGSDHFAANPTVSGRLVANLNTDMYLPINPLRKLLVNGLEESDLADDVRRAAARVGVEVITDPEPERNGFVRSDQYSFIRRGIPALSLKVGFARGSPEHERVLQWRQERYHGVDDEVTQPVDRRTAAAFNRLYAEVVAEVANRRTRPEWYATSAFRPTSEGTD